MQQEDWFMRQINLLGRVLRKILADILELTAQGLVEEGIVINMALKHQCTKYHRKLHVKQLTFVGFSDLVSWWLILEYENDL